MFLLVAMGVLTSAKSRCLNPVFHQRFEFQTELPGVSILRINVMDADTLTKDDLIGSTIIDLEERIMSKQWMLAGQGDCFEKKLLAYLTRQLNRDLLNHLNLLMLTLLPVKHTIGLCRLNLFACFQ